MLFVFFVDLFIYFFFNFAFLFFPYVSLFCVLCLVPHLGHIFRFVFFFFCILDGSVFNWLISFLVLLGFVWFCLVGHSPFLCVHWSDLVPCVCVFLFFICLSDLFYHLPGFCFLFSGILLFLF